jgi:hypothetical protein
LPSSYQTALAELKVRSGYSSAAAVLDVLSGFVDANHDVHFESFDVSKVGHHALGGEVATVLLCCVVCPLQ